MGPTTASLYSIIGLAAMGSGLRDLGATVDLGDGLEAAAMTMMSVPGLRDGSAPGSSIGLDVHLGLT